jgi:hypothetical protein
MTLLGNMPNELRSTARPQLQEARGVAGVQPAAAEPCHRLVIEQGYRVIEVLPILAGIRPRGATDLARWRRDELPVIPNMVAP